MSTFQPSWSLPISLPSACHCQRSDHVLPSYHWYHDDYLSSSYKRPTQEMFVALLGLLGVLCLSSPKLKMEAGLTARVQSPFVLRHAHIVLCITYIKSRSKSTANYRPCVLMLLFSSRSSILPIVFHCTCNVIVADPSTGALWCGSYTALMY